MGTILGNITTTKRDQEGSQRGARAQRSSLAGGAGLRAFRCVDRAGGKPISAKVSRLFLAWYRLERSDEWQVWWEKLKKEK